MRDQFKILVIILFLILVNFFINNTDFMINLFDFRLKLIGIVIRLLRVFRLSKLILLESIVTLIKIILGDGAFFVIVVIVVI